TTAGATVTVLERGAGPGGRSGSAPLRVGDQEWRFDQGAEFIGSFYRATRYLAQQAGMSRNDLVRLPLEGRIVIDGQRFPMPTSMRAMMRTPLLSRSSKRRVVTLGGRLGARSAPSWSRLAEYADLDDRDAAGYFAEVVGRDYAERILPATMDALMLSPSAVTSRVVGMAQFASAPGAHLYAPRGGLGALWAAVADRLSVRYRTSVTGLRTVDDGVLVDTTDGDELRADAVVLAGPASLAADLLPDGHPDLPLARDAEFSPVVKLHLALAAPTAGQYPVCPAGAGRHALAGVAPLESRQTGQVPAGRGGLEICASSVLSRELFGETDRVIRTMLLAECERLLGGPVGDILGWSVVRLSEGVPLFRVGWLRRLREHAAQAEVRDGAAARIRIAGDWLSSPSVEGAVRSALRACALLLRGR
ncbi:MAG: FAD-dependent oxidoreductase, partial [Actinocatenispora sp.]